MLCPPGGEWALGENRYRSLCGWVPSLFIWNYHNIVNQLYFSTKYKVEKKKERKLFPKQFRHTYVWSFANPSCHFPWRLEQNHNHPSRSPSQPSRQEFLEDPAAAASSLPTPPTEPPALCTQCQRARSTGPAQLWGPAWAARPYQPHRGSPGNHPGRKTQSRWDTDSIQHRCLPSLGCLWPWNPRAPSLCWPASSRAPTTIHSSFQEGLWALPGAWVRPAAQNTCFPLLEQPKPLLFGSCTLLAPGILTVHSSPWHPVPVTYSGFLLASLVAQTVKNLPAMQETQVQSLGQEDSLEKEMAAHSSILAWRIPWREEPGRLQSMGSQSWTWLSD